jgi:tetratricopeptide (TPR) repeat protein
VLEELYEDRLEDHAAELAGHFIHSSDPADLARAVEYSEIAAQKAISVNAYGEAVRLLDQAVEIQAVHDPDDRIRRCDLLLALGQALLPAGEPERALERIAPEAFALAEATGSRGRAARAARLAIEAVGRRDTMGPSWGSALPAWAERADRYAEPNTRLRVYADCALAMVHAGAGERNDGWSLASRALELARQIDDPEVLFWSAWTAMLGSWAYRDSAETVRLAEEFSSRPREGVSTRTLDLVLRRCQAVLLAAGDRDRAERLWRDLDDLATRTQDASSLVWPFTAEALRAILDGELEPALAATDRLAERAIELGIGAYGQAVAQRQRRSALAYLGRLEDPEPTPRGPRARALRCIQLARAGRLAEAHTELDGYLSAGPLPRDDTPPDTLALLLEAAVLLEDRKAAALLAQQASGIVALAVIDEPLNVARQRGAAEALLGDHDAARSCYADSLEWATKIRHRPEVALTRFQLGELLLEDALTPTLTQREWEKIQAEGPTHHNFAVDEFRAMKMQPALARALSHKGLLKA